MWWFVPFMTAITTMPMEIALAMFGPTERQRQAQERRRQFRVIEGGKRA
jgi:hypothetical protein